MKKGDYGLVRSNDPDFIFSIRPYPCPWYSLSEHDCDNLPDDDLKALMAWEEDARTFGHQIMEGSGINQLTRLVEICQKNGWSSHMDDDPSKNFNNVGNHIDCFLFQKIGEFLMRNPNPLPDEPVKPPDEVAEKVEV